MHKIITKSCLDGTIICEYAQYSLGTAARPMILAALIAFFFRKLCKVISPLTPSQIPGEKPTGSPFHLLRDVIAEIFLSLRFVLSVQILKLSSNLVALKVKGT